MNLVQQKDERLLYPLRLPFEVIKGEPRQEQARSSLQQAILAYFEVESSRPRHSMSRVVQQQLQKRPSKVLYSPNTEANPAQEETPKKNPNSETAPPAEVVGKENPSLPFVGFEMEEIGAGDQAFMKAKGKAQKELVRDDFYGVPDPDAEVKPDEPNGQQSPGSAQNRQTPRFVGGDKIQRDQFAIEEPVEGEENHPNSAIPVGGSEPVESEDQHVPFSKLPPIKKPRNNLTNTPADQAPKLTQKDALEYVDLLRLPKSQSQSKSLVAESKPIELERHDEVKVPPKVESNSGGVGSLIQGAFSKQTQDRMHQPVKIPEECRMPEYKTTVKKKIKFKMFLLQACVRLSRIQSFRYERTGEATTG